MTVADNPRLRVNRYPWNTPSSAARGTLETFLELAERRIELNPEALPFPPGVGQLVLIWMRARLDMPPPA
jgi:hypothetical protein